MNDRIESAVDLQVIDMMLTMRVSVNLQKADVLCCNITKQDQDMQNKEEEDEYDE